MATDPQKRQITVSEYYAMAESGILAPDERVELIEGEIYRMAPIGNRHAGCVKRLNGILTPLLAGRATIGIQDPVRLSDLSEPEPDVSVLRYRSDGYGGGHPGSADVFFLVEAADTSLDFDQRVKLPLYARSGIPEVWIVDLPQGLIEIHRSPQAGRLREIRQARRGERLSPAAFPDLDLDTAQILG
jgi:Uma2 family endonuclease